MPAQPYTSRFVRRGAGGLQQMFASAVKVTAGDTIDFGPDFAKVIAASIVGDTKNAPAIAAIAGVAGTVVTLAGAYANDDIDMVVIGPALAS